MKMPRIGWLFLFVLFGLWGCARQPVAVTPIPTAVLPTVGPIPTLLPTFTPLPQPGLLPTTTPLATMPPREPTPTLVSPDEKVVELRYRIPALGLDRRLEGDVSGRIIMIDETTGLAIQRNNQLAILLELQQVLPPLALEAVPPNCDRCVELTYGLPLNDIAGEGWLQDPVLLASIENFMVVGLGAHFPPDTAIGLRRSASPYWPAHTIAFLENGAVWRWLATEAAVDTAVTATSLNLVLDETAVAELNSSYQVGCSGAALESLLLPVGGESKEITIVCPEFSLPLPLQSVYVELDRLVAPKLIDESAPVRPPGAFPLTAVVDYKRADEARLTVYQDNRVVVDLPPPAAGAGVYTATLTSSEIVSLTTPLLASGQIRLGLDTFRTSEPVTTTVTPTPPTSVIVVRGPNGVYDGAFTQLNNPLLEPLDQLLLRLSGGSSPPTATPDVTGTTTATPLVEPTLTVTPTPFS